MFNPTKIVSLIMLVYACCPNFAFGQQAIWRIGIERNLDVYKPYTRQAQKTGKQMHGFTTSLSVMRTLNSTENWNWSLGPDLKFVHEKVENYKVIEYVNNLYEVDQLSRSYNLGFKAELNRFLFATPKHGGSFGIHTSLYFFEWFTARFIDENGTYRGGSNLSGSFIFPLSSVNAALFYRHLFMPQALVPIAILIRCGANVYSDWDQFRRYAWLGLGLEIGLSDREKSGTQNLSK